jgi:hypothetical protein
MYDFAILKIILQEKLNNHICSNPRFGFSLVCLVSFVVVFRTERSALDIGTIWSGHTSSLFATVLVLFNQKFNNFAVGKGTEPVGLNGSLVDKDVLSAIIRDKKTESLDGVEPEKGVIWE